MPSDKGEVVLGVDLDVVCADFYARMREIAAEWREVGLETLTAGVSYGLEERDSHTYRERYWSPTVLIRGSLAMVWAPYEFWIDGKTSHCGVRGLWRRT